jgi:hypothetical protein
MKNRQMLVFMRFISFMQQSLLQAAAPDDTGVLHAWSDESRYVKVR